MVLYKGYEIYMDVKMGIKTIWMYRTYKIYMDEIIL